ncbi:MAG TPA: 4-hydroxythreonine-4-phosphate dehydrogenase PdxA [Vicinamibacterales bacterium]|nr:4-hydroxythreonine-4-phosphate dehydrogenase PdxA [Vicinamibacterales bacterium]
MPLPLVAVTVGDPSGIGPEIAVKAARHPRVVDVCRAVIYGPQTADELAAFPAGQVSAVSARAAYDAIVRATGDARAGRVQAIVTAPINKAAFAAAGYPWRGHTDLLAHLCGVQDAAMMFWSDRLRVVLATVHIPLAEVPRALTRERLLGTIRLTASSLPKFGVVAPKLAVAGLNPHAGESGLLGAEEEGIVIPTIATARSEGVDVSGPFPADTIFLRAARGEFDAVVALYHDQGLIPVKLLAFGRAVNVTLGLPIVRTSVDHGTAFDIARQGIADEGSLVEAVLLAARLVG